MKKMFVFSVLLLAHYQYSFAQTLKIQFVENLFIYNKTKILDTLKTDGYNNLTDEQIFKEEFIKDPHSTTLLGTKKFIYNEKNVRRIFELRRFMGGGVSKVSILMKEPSLNKLELIIWNANLRWSASFYVRELESLGYRLIDNSNNEYRNAQNTYYVIVQINKYDNEMIFTMSKVQK